MLQITILDENDSVKFTSALREVPEEGKVYDETISPAFIAFSASGTIKAVNLLQ